MTRVPDSMVPEGTVCIGHVADEWEKDDKRQRVRNPCPECHGELFLNFTIQEYQCANCGGGFSSDDIVETEAVHEDRIEQVSNRENYQQAEKKCPDCSYRIFWHESRFARYYYCAVCGRDFSRFYFEERDAE